MYLLLTIKLYMNNDMKSYLLPFIIYAYSITCTKQIGFANILHCGAPKPQNPKTPKPHDMKFRK